MEKKESSIWKICSVVLLIIVMILSYCLFNKNSKPTSSVKKSSTSVKSNRNENEEDTFRNIRVDEDLSTDGTIEGLENVRWSNARIMQHDGETEVSIMLNNESKEEKIPAAKLEVTLLDKNKKVIATQETEMKEISENYGYTNLDLKFDLQDYVVVYDIQISCQ